MTTAQLIAVPGIGISTVEKYGTRQIYRILEEAVEHAMPAGRSTTGADR